MKLDGLVFDESVKDAEDVLTALIEKADEYGDILKKDFENVIAKFKDNQTFFDLLSDEIHNGEILTADIEKQSQLLEGTLLIGMTAAGDEVKLRYTTWDSPAHTWLERIGEDGDYSSLSWEARIIVEMPLEEGFSQEEVPWDELYRRYVDLQIENRKLNKMIDVYEGYTDGELSFNEDGELVY